ncbi:MAG: sodium:solute symporter [Opitutaceae bacterium]|nr:sodium:solute symporter [Opitutaceae bacterium]
MMRRLTRSCILFCLAWTAAHAGADNLVTVSTGSLPAPPGSGPLQCLAGASGQPLAIRDGAAWEYDERAKVWNPLAFRTSGAVAPSPIIVGSGIWLLTGQSEDGIGTSLVPILAPAAPAPILPSLPIPLRQLRGATSGGALHLAGIDGNGAAHWLSLDLSVEGAPWKSLPPWSASPRSISTLVAQDASLLLTSPDASGERDEVWRWTAADGWQSKHLLPGRVVTGAAQALGQAHVIYLVQLPTLPDGSRRLQLVTFHTVTATIATQGAPWNGEAHLGAGWRHGLIWDRPDGSLSSAEIQGGKELLRPLDWVMLLAYFGLIAWIGAYCYRREKKRSTESFFVGSRSIPWWAAGISLYASNSSSIGYIATTAKAYTTNWQYFLSNVVNVFALLFVAFAIVPLLRRLQLVSVFHYLDQRFHRSVRMCASALCILMHLGGRMSVILFLPSLAISTVTGLDVTWSILMMGVVTIAYTALGGMKAVIWTDVAQVIVKFGGLFFALGFILWALPHGTDEFISIARADDKTRMIDWSFDLTKATIWTFIFLQIMETVLTFPKDQVLMQRVFATKSEQEARRSVWVFAVIVLPGSLILYLIGTGLYVYYHTFPERMNPLLPHDATLPLFVAAELPAGVTGLVLAGLFSAAMGTLSSILNSVSTLVSVDFYEKLSKHPNPATSIRIAEWVTILAGAVGIGCALLLSRFNISSYLDLAIEFAGLFGGSFGGAYTLGMFTRRANWQGVIIGMGTSFAATFAIWWHHLVHPFLYLGISILISIVVGWFASLFFPPPPETCIQGLTVFNAGRPAASGG